MITEQQYQHVLSTGQLPSGTVVSNSPVAEEKQTIWTELTEKQIITPEELAYMLFIGTLPDMTPEETKAFEELAPVYEPDRGKRLTYEVRQKHSMVELIRFAKKEKAEFEKEHQAAIERAEQEGLPITNRTQTSGSFELIRFDHDLPVYYGSCNLNAARTISTDKVQPGGISGVNDLTGTNVLIGLFDFGPVLKEHCELKTNNVRNIVTGTTNDHSTAIAGTLAAQGIDQQAQGMATDAAIEVRKNIDIPYEISIFIYSNYQNGKNPWLSNHSYDMKCGWTYLGDSLCWFGDTNVSQTEDLHFGLYTEYQSANIDLTCHYNVYHLPVYAAGNDRLEDHPVGDTTHDEYINGNWLQTTIDRPADGGTNGYDTLNPFAVAKNILTVGAIPVLTNGFIDGMVVTGAVYSSCGPTDDGRIKPDVVADGESIYTLSVEDTNAYQICEGTSFAAPAVAGSAALLQEVHQLMASNAAPLLASTLKGVIIHTADDSDGIPGPDYRTGWGVMNTERAASLIVINDVNKDSLPRIKECTILNGESIEFGIRKASGTLPLKVTICWTDPAGPVQPYALDPTNSVLVNDLDLRVISPDGTTNYPWVLDPQNPANPATTDDNTRDNVEQVCITNPVNGIYQVKITHKGTLSDYGYVRQYDGIGISRTNSAAQDVSIIISGNEVIPAPQFAITNIVASSNQCSFQWSGVAGALYAVKTCNNLLISNNWVSNDLVRGLSEHPEWNETTGNTNALRFYRLQRLR